MEHGIAEDEVGGGEGAEEAGGAVEGAGGGAAAAGGDELGGKEDLLSQVSSETDPVALFPKVIALLHLQVYNKALQFQAPGRAIHAAVLQLKDKVPDSTYKALMDYHSIIVTLLALQSAATGDEEDCSSDRILSKKELLESKMPELKGLVLSSSTSPASV